MANLLREPLKLTCVCIRALSMCCEFLSHYIITLKCFQVERGKGALSLPCLVVSHVQLCVLTRVTVSSAVCVCVGGWLPVGNQRF